MNKIKNIDNIQDIIIQLSEGNPGALTTCFEILRETGSNIFEAIPLFLTLDSMELYGSHLYMLWNDCCDRNIKAVIDVINGFITGKITKDDINERIKKAGYGKSFSDLLEEK